jgi:hypothetical protein
LLTILSWFECQAGASQLAISPVFPHYFGSSPLRARTALSTGVLWPNVAVFLHMHVTFARGVHT